MRFRAGFWRAFGARKSGDFRGLRVVDKVDKVDLIYSKRCVKIAPESLVFGGCVGGFFRMFLLRFWG